MVYESTNSNDKFVHYLTIFGPRCSITKGGHGVAIINFDYILVSTSFTRHERPSGAISQLFAS